MGIHQRDKETSGNTSNTKEKKWKNIRMERHIRKCIGKQILKIHQKGKNTSGNTSNRKGHKVLEMHQNKRNIPVIHRRIK